MFDYLSAHPQVCASSRKETDFLRSEFTGDLVVDAYAGSGTTLVAAAQLGRRGLGAEMDAGRFDLATRRLRRGYTPDFFSAA